MVKKERTPRKELKPKLAGRLLVAVGKLQASIPSEHANPNPLSLQLLTLLGST
jgi:hypothetical protein